MPQSLGKALFPFLRNSWRDWWGHSLKWSLQRHAVLCSFDINLKLRDDSVAQPFARKSLYCIEKNERRQNKAGLYYCDNCFFFFVLLANDESRMRSHESGTRHDDTSCGRKQQILQTKIFTFQFWKYLFFSQLFSAHWILFNCFSGLVIDLKVVQLTRLLKKMIHVPLT